MNVMSLALFAVVQAQPAPARMILTPDSTQLAVDAAVQLAARVVDPEGGAISGIRVRWFSEDAAIATVDAAGRVTAHRPGVVRILAAGGPASAVATITVTDLPPTRIALRVPPGPLLAGTSVPISAEVVNRVGTQLGTDGLAYESSNTAVAGVDAAGRIHLRAPGTARITARTGDASATLDVRVEENPIRSYRIAPETRSVRTGDVIRFRVEGEAEGGGGGARAPDLYPGWAVSGRGASIEAEGVDGVFVAEDPGRYLVTAIIGEGAARTAVVVVAPRRYEATLSSVGRGPNVDHHSGDVWVFEGVDGRDYAYIGTFGYDWMKAWDVTDPARPALTDSIQLDARRINDVKIHPNNRIGVLTREGASNRRNGIVILDLSRPAHPTIASEFTETVTGGVHNVWIEPNDVVYAVHNGTSDLHMIDISDPRNPFEAGRWGLPKVANLKSLHDVIVQEGYAYLSYWDDGLVMLDVGAGTHGGTPTEPVLVSQFKYPIGNTHTAFRAGRYLFVGDEIYPPNWNPDFPIEARGYVHVLDLSDPQAPREVARYEVPEAGAHNFWVEGDRLYIGYYQAGLRVIDISGELRGDLYRQGREIAVLKTSDEYTATPNWPMTWGAQIFKGHIFTSDLNSGLWIARFDETVLVP